MENPCLTCKYKDIDWKRIEELKDAEINPMCINCYKKECYTQSCKPTHRVTVDIADNEVLVKYTIKEEDMQTLIGRTVQLSNYVCTGPDEVTDEVTAAAIEDGIMAALPDVEKTFTVITSPVTVSKYLNGEYEDTFMKYMGEKTAEIVKGFFK